MCLLHYYNSSTLHNKLSTQFPPWSNILLSTQILLCDHSRYSHCLSAVLESSFLDPVSSVFLAKLSFGASHSPWLPQKGYLEVNLLIPRASKKCLDSTIILDCQYNQDENNFPTEFVRHFPMHFIYSGTVGKFRHLLNFLSHCA